MANSTLLQLSAALAQAKSRVAAQRRAVEEQQDQERRSVAEETLRAMDLQLKRLERYTLAVAARERGTLH